MNKLKGREKVKVVCIDMSSTYRSIIHKWFPNAQIVSDRFHVVRIIQHHFMKLCRDAVPTVKSNRKYLRLLRTKPSNLSIKQKQNLKDLFKEYPVLKPIHCQMIRIWNLMLHKRKGKKQCRKLATKLMSYIQQLEYEPMPYLDTLANTLKDWSEEIAAMWRFSKNNGITEGFHRKMKLIQRRAYGFRNFDNYRLRVIAQCG